MRSRSNVILIVADALRADHLALARLWPAHDVRPLRRCGSGAVRLASSAVSVCNESACGLRALASSRYLDAQATRPMTPARGAAAPRLRRAHTCCRATTPTSTACATPTGRRTATSTVPHRRRATSTTTASSSTGCAPRPLGRRPDDAAVPPDVVARASASASTMCQSSAPARTTTRLRWMGQAYRTRCARSTSTTAECCRPTVLCARSSTCCARADTSRTLWWW